MRTPGLASAQHLPRLDLATEAAVRTLASALAAKVKADRGVAVLHATDVDRSRARKALTAATQKLSQARADLDALLVEDGA